jgi:hypothetical protein
MTESGDMPESPDGTFDGVGPVADESEVLEPDEEMGDDGVPNERPEKWEA